jgi:CRISPR/Cas system endoribonuclease Cas6 (RAMP superfamily)
MHDLSLFLPYFSKKLLFFSDSDLTSQLVAARAELATLQGRYDALHTDRDRLAQTLSENMKKYKRFKRWIISMKDKIPPKPTEHDETCACSCSTSTPGLKQQSVMKMLETPMTPMSLYPLSFFVSVQCTFR